MKKITLLSAAIAIAMTLMSGKPGAWAQNTCATEVKPSVKAYFDATREARQGFDLSTMRGAIRWIPVKFHITRLSNGTGGISESALPALLNRLNTEFSAANVQFFQCGDPEVICNSTYYDIDMRTDEDDILSATHNVPNTMNIWFFNFIMYETGSEAIGVGWYPSEEFEQIFMKNANASSPGLLEHEAGHFFGLRHTHEGVGTPLGECANGSNCATAGDEVCDTPAEPNMGLPGRVSGCAYVGTPTDPCGSPYTPMVNNYMGYSPLNCINAFTSGQYSQVAFAAVFDRSNLGCSTAPAPCTSIITSFPYSQSFESGTGDWTNATDDNFNWSVVTTGPQAPTTGPSSAAAGTKFAYIEATGNLSNKIAYFYSPCFDLNNTASPRAEYKYHMTGANIGTLKFEGAPMAAPHGSPLKPIQARKPADGFRQLFPCRST